MRIEVVTPPISQSELSKVSIFPGRRSVDQWEASIGCARRGLSGPGTRSWEPGGGGREMIRSVLSAIRSRHHRHWSSKRAPVIQYQVSDNIRLWWNCIEKWIFGRRLLMVVKHCSEGESWLVLRDLSWYWADTAPAAPYKIDWIQPGDWGLLMRRWLPR